MMVHGRPLHRSVANAARADHIYYRHQQDLQIEHQRPPLDIGAVEGNLFGYGQVIAAIHLRPAGDAGHQCIHPRFSSQPDEIVLVEQGRSWSDKCHMANQHAPELRDFIKAALAKKPADRRQPLRGIFEQMRRDGGRIDRHCAKLRHQENLFVPADPFGPVYCRPSRRQRDGKKYPNCERQRQRQGHKNGYDIDCAFQGSVHG